MKSFFKKLAFVMALAMVVSLAAPAGSAMAAETLNMTVQGTVDVITEYRLEKVGDTVDFQFWKAPSNWKTDFAWASDNEAVATVDQNGLVTAVAEGTANITVTVVGSYVGAVKVLVGEEKVELAYEAVQVNHNTVDFVFNKNVEYAAGDVTLTKMYGDYPINWPVSAFACKDNKVTISTYVDFEDGDKYIVKIGAEDEGTAFTTTIGAVDEIKVTWKSTGLAKEEAGVAYAPLDEDDTEIPVYLAYELFANGVNVTKAKKYADGEIAFDLAVENDKVDIDESVLYFEDYTAAYAVVVPSFTYEGAEDDVTFKGAEVVIGATPVPQYGISSLVAWSIVKAGDDKVTWYGVNDKKGFPLFDDANKDHTLVALVQDNLGKYYAFPSDALDGIAADKYKYNNADVLDFANIGDTDDDAEDYRLEFKSTNDNTLFVGNDDGSITTIVDKKTSVLVSLYDENEDGDEYLVRHLAALTVDIDAQRKIDDIKVNVKFSELPFVVNENGSTKGIVEVQVVDQYGANIAANGLEVKTTVDKDGFSAKTLTATDKGNGKYEIEVDGADYSYLKNAGTEKEKEIVLAKTTYSVKVKDTGVKDEFVVKVAEPKYNADGTIKVEEVKASAATINQTIADSSKLGDLVKTITVNEFSNDLNVGVKNDNITLLTKGNAFLKDGKGDLAVTSAQAEVGDVFVVVYGPNGEAIGSDMVKEAEAGKYTFTSYATKSVNVASGSAIDVMDYKATGTYTVKVYTITREYESKVSKCDVETTTFDLSRSNPVVALKKQDVVDLTDEGAIDLETLVTSAFSFKFGGNDLAEDKAFFTDINYKYNADAGRVYIYSVKVYAPLNNGNDTVYFDAGTVTINKYVEVEALEQ
jgi:hypothetical protein